MQLKATPRRSIVTLFESVAFLKADRAWIAVYQSAVRQQPLAHAGGRVKASRSIAGARASTCRNVPESPLPFPVNALITSTAMRLPINPAAGPRTPAWAQLGSDAASSASPNRQ